MSGEDGDLNDAGDINLPDQPGTQTRTFSQEDVNKLVADQVRRARSQASKAVLDELGVSKVEDLKSIVTKARDAETAAMSEHERLVAQAKEATAAALADRTAAAQERHSLNVERALSKAGASGDTAKLARLVEADPGANEADINTAIETLKASFPALFAPPPKGTPSPSEPATGGSPKRTTSTADPLSVGAEKAKAYAAGQRSF